MSDKWADEELMDTVRWNLREHATGNRPIVLQGGYRHRWVSLWYDYPYTDKWDNLHYMVQRGKLMLNIR